MDQVSSFTCTVSVYFNYYNNPPVALNSVFELPLFSPKYTSLGFVVAYDVAPKYTSLGFVVAYDVDYNQSLHYSILSTHSFFL